MKPTSKKAVDLVLTDKVTLDTYTVGVEGDITSARGTVKGYTTKVTYAGSTVEVECDCEYGQHRTTSHSHDQALRLAAYRQERSTE